MPGLKVQKKSSVPLFGHRVIDVNKADSVDQFRYIIYTSLFPENSQILAGFPEGEVFLNGRAWQHLTPLVVRLGA
jgi:hypothetical protein